MITKVNILVEFVLVNVLSISLGVLNYDTMPDWLLAILVFSIALYNLARATKIFLKALRNYQDRNNSSKSN